MIIVVVFIMMKIIIFFTFFNNKNNNNIKTKLLLRLQRFNDTFHHEPGTITVGRQDRRTMSRVLVASSLIKRHFTAAAAAMEGPCQGPSPNPDYVPGDKTTSPFPNADYDFQLLTLQARKTKACFISY